MNPERTLSILRDIGIEDTRGGRGRLDAEPANETLADAVEEVGHEEYEIAFALTSLSETQRKARGVPPKSRSIVVRVVLARPVRFCIHLPDYDSESTSHTGWKVSRGVPTATICTTRPNKLAHSLDKSIVKILSQSDITLPTIFDAVTAKLRDPPEACLACGGPMPRRWAPTTCSRQCSLVMRRAPLEIRLDQFSVEPAVADLLLTCVYAAAKDAPPAGIDFLPGCPVSRDRLTNVLDSSPAMAGITTASDVRSFVRGRNSDGMAQDREDLMSWLALYFRGFMIEATGSYLIPSMPGARQFLLLNSPPEREAQWVQGPSSGPVFHGTVASRLLVILGGGLRVMSGGPGQANGAAYGPGVYCGDDPSTSLSFCGSTGSSWRNSTLGNRTVMLGCELASYARPGNGSIHVVQPDTRLLVRYVFMLPPGFRAPARHHVDTAMSSVFARIRNGM